MIVVNFRSETDRELCETILAGHGVEYRRGDGANSVLLTEVNRREELPGPALVEIEVCSIGIVEDV